MNTISTDSQPLDMWQKEAEGLYEAMEYRPVVVAILRKEDGRVLFVESAKGINIWGFPQGGKDRGEGLEEALRRELAEETSITPDIYDVIGLRCVNQLDIPRAREGFMKGKRYYYFLCECRQEPSVHLLAEENSAYRWIDPVAAEALLVGVTSEKRQSILEALKFAGM